MKKTLLKTLVVGLTIFGFTYLVSAQTTSPTPCGLEPGIGICKNCGGVNIELCNCTHCEGCVNPCASDADCGSNCKGQSCTCKFYAGEDFGWCWQGPYCPGSPTPTSTPTVDCITIPNWGDCSVPTYCTYGCLKNPEYGFVGESYCTCRQACDQEDDNYCSDGWCPPEQTCKSNWLGTKCGCDPPASPTPTSTPSPTPTPTPPCRPSCDATSCRLPDGRTGSCTGQHRGGVFDEPWCECQ